MSADTSQAKINTFGGGGSLFGGNRADLKSIENHLY